MYHAGSTGLIGGGTLAGTGQNVLAGIVGGISLLVLGLALLKLARRVPPG